MSSKDPVRDVLELHAGQAIVQLIKLARRGVKVMRQSYHAEVDGVAVNISISSVAIPVLLPCEAIVLDILYHATTRLTTSGVINATNKAGYDFGEATVKRALAKLSNVHHLIGSSRKSPRGYWHPDRFPEWPVK